MNRRESRDAGQNLKTASSADAQSPATLCEQARAHLECGRTLDAQLCCDQALAADPACAEAMHLMGLLSFRAEQADHAIEWLSRAVEQDPNPRYLIDLGLALKRHGRFDEAFSAFRKAREFDPRDAEAAYQTGFLLFQSGRLEEALAALESASRLRANHAPTVQMLALTLQNLGRLEEALAEMSRAQALDPANADICNDLGVVLLRLRRHRQALAWFDKALEQRADFKLAHNNKAVTLGCLRRFDEALAVYAALKEADPNDAEPDWNAALLHLLTGNFGAGWGGREARWNVPHLPIARHGFVQPKWLGQEPIAGKTILIYQDEGLGDVIQFVRYVPMVAAQGARIVLLVDPPLVPLLSKLPGVAECIPRSANATVHFDVHCAITCLPLAFGTRLETIPARVPYLPAPDEGRVRAWEQRLGPHDKLRVGLVWSGNLRHMDNENRSLPLRALLPLLDLDATFVSLQKDMKEIDRATLRERPDIIDLTALLTDLGETAALMSCLDLVITVDTSMAHLAGALGRPTWIMLQYTPDWRWLLDRDDCPWYPTARLFRQTDSHDFGEVVARVRPELKAQIAARSANTNAAVPDSEADALHLQGLQALGARQYDQAIDWISRAIRRDPKPLYLTSLGTTLLAQGRREEAVQVFDKAVQLRPDDADLWCNLGLALVEAGSVADAIASLQYALRLNPRHFDAAHKAALLLAQEERHKEALTCFNLSNELKPDHFPTLYMRARTLQRLNRFEEALAGNRRAQALDPLSADNRYNLASVLTELRRFDEAIAVYREALAQNPADADAEWSLALLQLLLGDFESGWRAQEARWNVPALSAGYPKFPQPKWLGVEPVAGRTVIVCANEGFGDSIQFVRYVPLLAARGARVILLVPAPLVPLLSGLEGVAQCLPFSAEARPDADFHVPVSSLPLAFGTRLDTIPASVPYLPRPAAERVQSFEQRLGAHDRLRVGLVWSGNPNHRNDRNRSLPLRMLSRLFDLDAIFVSLQKDPRPDDEEILAQSGIIDLSADLKDFSDTTALISCLDLVISVDTSTAHLAGALGCPTWVLLPYMPDWRWLLDREDSPWYPTARLFRQDETRDYVCVIARVRGELSAQIAAWRASRS